VTPMTREESLTAFVGEARWFGGKGREFEVTGLTDTVLADDVTTTLLTVSYAEGGSDLYQVPIASYDGPQERLTHALIGQWDDQWHYDAVHDREAMQAWLRAFATAAARGADAETGRRGALPPPPGPSTTSTWSRTRRCSRASRATPRSP